MKLNYEFAEWGVRFIYLIGCLMITISTILAVKDGRVALFVIDLVLIGCYSFLAWFPYLLLGDKSNNIETV